MDEKELLKIDEDLRLLVYTRWPNDAKHALPQCIFHYTSVEVLFKILEESRIQLTHFRYMEDISEQTWAIQTIIDNLKNRSCWEKELKLKDILTRVIDRLEKYLKDKDFDKNQIFIASFSRDGNNLSQWREYGDRCAGISLGINPSGLQLDFFTNSSKRYFSREGGFINVIYEQSEIKETIDNIYNKAAEFIRERLTNELLLDHVEVEKIADILYGLYLEISIAIKHPSYLVENEVRLVCRLAGQKGLSILYRGGKTPYIESSLIDTNGLIPISTIFTGPKLPQSDIASINKALEDHGYKFSWEAVLPSGIPY